MLDTLDEVMGDNLSQKVAEEPLETWWLPETSFPVIGLDVVMQLELAKHLYGFDISNYHYAIGISLGEYIAGCLMNELPLEKTIKMLSYFGESM